MESFIFCAVHVSYIECTQEATSCSELTIIRLDSSSNLVVHHAFEKNFRNIAEFRVLKFFKLHVLE